jgi:hypothetical protein
MVSVRRQVDGWYCPSCDRGRRHTLTIGNLGEADADATSAQVEDRPLRFERRSIQVPPGVDIVEFSTAARYAPGSIHLRARMTRSRQIHINLFLI